MPCAPSTGARRCCRDAGGNSFCTLARLPSPSTSCAIAISSTLAFEMPTARMSPSSRRVDERVHHLAVADRERSGRWYW